MIGTPTMVVLKRMGLGVVLALAMSLLLPAMYAQSTGTVTGTVTDQAGAVVAKAKVSLVNEASQDVRQTVSNGDGYFSFGTVNPGTYTVKVAASGFKTWDQPGIAVRPGDVRNVPAISMQVGSQQETVEVQATADEIAPVDSGERSSVLTSKQIDNLSLEGRDATELLRTLPGFNNFQGGSVNNQGQDFTVISPTGGAVGQGSSGNGSPYRGGTDLISDGAHIIDNGCNCGATATVNGDMVSEVKVQTSNFGADSSKGPIVVNAIGKSGGNAYHGEVYLHLRDQSLNSLDWSFNRLQQTSPAGTVPSPLGRFLYPGMSFGGPVPHTNKKLVFWTGFEYYYQHGFPMTGLTTLGLLTDTVPTVSMRAGNFDVAAPDNQALCGGHGLQGFNPTCNDLTGTGGFTWADGNGAVISNANIPTTNFDPGAVILMNQIPLPNADPTKTGGFNYLKPENLDQNGWMWRTRGDWNISDNTKLYVTYQVQKETDNQPVHLWWEPFNSIPFPNGMASKDNSQTISGHFLHVFSPTLTNDAAFGLASINYPLVQNNKNSWGITANNYPYQGLYHNNYNMMPDIGDGYWLAGMPQMIQPDIFAAGGGTFVWKKWNDSVEDNLTKVFKTHTIKTGFYWEKTVNNQGAFSDYNGTVQVAQGGPFNACNGGPTPSGGCTGNASQIGSNNPVASFLLGVGTFDQVTKYALDNLWYPTYSAYVQDDWKASKRLTLNLGLRLDHLGAWRSPNSQGVATFTGNPNTQQPLFSWHGIDSSIPLTGRNVPLITWEPRLGLAYDLRGNGKTVLRGGWGEYGYRDQYNDAGGAADLAQGALTFTTSQPVTLGYVNALGNSGGPTASVGTGSGLLLSDHQQPLSRNYNFTISQQLPFSSLLEIGYVGSQTLYGDIQGNGGNLDTKGINFLPIGAAFLDYGNGTGSCPTPLSPVNQAANNPANKGNCDPSASGIPLAAYPLNAIYGNADVAVVRHLAKSNYNGLQTSWIRQKGRLTYNLNYTWSKTLGTQGTAQFGGLPPDATNLSHDYGISSIDRTHVINLSYVYQTGNPIHGNKLLQGVVNGWSISGITTWQSGPYIPGLTNTNLGLGGTGPAYTYNNGANVANYSINSSDWLGTANQNLQPTVLCDPTANLKPHQYFNADCFGVPAAGQQGAYQLPYIHGPAYFNSDLAIFKTFKLTERQNMEFRASGFNFLNHPLDSFQGVGGDDTIGFTYTCNGVSASNNPACVNGAGSFVRNTGTLPYSLGGGPGTTSFQSGYASTRFGRRVIEFSVKYTF